MIKINFDDLFNKYNSDLIENLRGFGSDEEFLKFWVPGTSPIKSFTNLIDALYESNQAKFVIYYSKNKFDKNFSEKVNLFLEKIGSKELITSGGIIILKIIINSNSYNNFIKKKKNLVAKPISKKIDEKNFLSKFVSEKKINDIYLQNLKMLKANDYYSNQAKKYDSQFSSQIEDVNLTFQIENKIITKAFHDCNNNEILRKLLNIFFDICMNKNIQEAADHSLIYLEEKIRLQNNKLIKPGIILPSHAGTYFDNLNLIIRDVFYKYANLNLIKFGINKNYIKKSYYWINLSEKEKVRKINEVLVEISKKYNLSNKSILVQSIDSNFRINLGVDKNFNYLQSKKNLLLEIEINLKKLDDTLEVFVDEVLDKNKLRLKNSPQTKLLN